jgi:hypothetical protein
MDQENDRLLISMTPMQRLQILHLVELGYGNGKTPASVVEYIVARFVDDMHRHGLNYVNKN